MAVEHVSDDTFEEQVLRSETPCIVDLWAPWCGPCRSLAPVLDEIAAEYDGQIKVCKMNVDENNATASHYNVRSIPNLLFIKNGELLHQSIGNVPKDQITTAIKHFLLG